MREYKLSKKGRAGLSAAGQRSGKLANAKRKAEKKDLHNFGFYKADKKRGAFNETK